MYQTGGSVAMAFAVKTGERIFSAFTGLLAGVLIAYSGYVLYDNLYIQNKAFANAGDYIDYRPEIIDDGETPLGGNTLAAVNKDYRAWLTVHDTLIDYPVVQGEDDLYYSSHDVYGKSSLTGAVYLAAANSPDLSDNYNLVYGHHMDNAAMFGGLDYFAEEEYFRAHRSAVMITEDKLYDLTIFAALRTDAYDRMIYNAGNRDLDGLMQYLAQHSIRYDAQAADGAEKLAAFSTCASAETDGRFVVVTVMKERVTESEAVAPAAVIDNEKNDPGSDPEEVSTEKRSNRRRSPDANPERANAEAVNAEAADSDEETELFLTDADEPVQAAEIEKIEEEETPLASFAKPFQPSGHSYGTDAWALINLICVIMTAYLFLPLLHLRAKFGRGGLMKKVNRACDEAGKEQCYGQKGYSRRFKAGVAAELVVSILAVIAFLYTEDMSMPMVLIDRWTPFMLLILLGNWLIDLILIRYRKNMPEEEEAAVPAQA